MQPLREADILFPSASHSLSTTLTSLKRTNLSITNRLHSIARDAAFVTTVAETLQLPLIANERCGSWYVQPERKAGSAYFKSTDGHFGQWAFSLRRLNLGVLGVIGEKGGCIIIDSTRRGKSMPDAMSKTVGIWIAVLNRLLFADVPEAHILHTPRDVVSESEHAQIEDRLEAFVRDTRGLALDVAGLRAKLKKPMRPLWVTPATDLESLRRPDTSDGFATVVLCTASSKSSGQVRDDAGYVQGAADDSEAWACGLEAVTFWQNSAQLLAASEDDLPCLIKELVTLKRSVEAPSRATRVSPPGSVWVGDNSCVEDLSRSADVMIRCGAELSDEAQRDITKAGAKLINLPCSSGKNGSRQLRACLPQLETLQGFDRDAPQIVVTCHDGKDLSVGVALCLICMFANEAAVMDFRQRQPVPNKAEIKKRLSWILVSKPDASPSRATLQSVNACLMG